MKKGWKVLRFILLRFFECVIIVFVTGRLISLHFHSNISSAICLYVSCIATALSLILTYFVRMCTCVNTEGILQIDKTGTKDIYRLVITVPFDKLDSEKYITLKVRKCSTLNQDSEEQNATS